MKQGFTPHVIASNTCSERSVGTKVARQSQSGFTLMELLVYMMIVGIIVVVAGQAFSNSTKFRVRTQNMLKATQEAENVATLFKADVSQMGAKSSMEGTASENGADYGLKFFNVCTGTATENCIPKTVYVNPDASDATNKDSSSFELTTSNNISDLKVRRVRYDGSGKYKSVELVHWFVNGTTLYRSCYTLAGEANSEGSGTSKVDICKMKPATIENEVNDAVEIATGVTEFKVSAASPSAGVDNVQIFPPCPSTPCTNEFKLFPRTGEDNFVTFHIANSSGAEGEGGTAVTLSQFFSNFSNTTNGGQLLDNSEWKQNQAVALKNETFSGTASWKDRCNGYGKISLEKDQEYEISFEIAEPDKKDKSLMFVPGEDHMSVGFRSAATGDFLKSDGKVLVDDFMFFPPINENGSGKRTMRFTMPAPVNNACLTFTFASFSPLVSQGNVTIENLKLKKVASSNYSFETAFDASAAANRKEKKNVKAFKLKLQISRGGKDGKKGETGEIEMVVPTPGNGPRD